jgi:hypothetical protein
MVVVMTGSESCHTLLMTADLDTVGDAIIRWFN